jgi:uncharacterized protein YcnI
MMKVKKLLAILIVCMLVPIVLAAHQPTVKLTPSELSVGGTAEMTFTVANEKVSKHNIVKIEVEIPKDEKNVSFFDVKNMFVLPAGWQSSVVVSEGLVSKIIFSAIGAGVAPGSSQTFVFSSVTAPKAIGLYQFGWMTTDAAEAVKSGSLPINVKLGSLTTFSISNVPQEVVAGDSFNMTVTAYATFDMVKADYTGTVMFTSTDSKAKFTPSTYKFTPADNGKKQIAVTFYTPGNQTFTVKDLQAGVEATSQPVLVKPAVPRELSVSIEGGAETTEKTLVHLSLSAVNAKECRYSNDKVFWSAYEPYTESREWKLEPGEGEKFVYFQCRNEHGESDVAYARITLSTGFVLTLPLVLSIVALIVSVFALIVASKGKRKSKEESS